MSSGDCDCEPAPEYTEDVVARLRVQKLEELKMQVMAQNPQLLGVGMPGERKE